MATKDPTNPTAPAMDPTQQWAPTITSTDPRDAPYGGKHIGAAPPGAHQNPDGSWDWDTAAPAAAPAPATNTSTAQPTAGSTDSGVQSGVGGTGGAISTTPQPAGQAPQTINDVFSSTILQQLQGPTPDQAAAGAADSGVVKAYNTQQARQYDTDRAQAAEAAAAGGFTGSGAQNTQQMGLAQQRAENTANFTGQVAIQLMNNRRTDIQNALTMAQNAGQFDAAQSLQQQLAQMDAAIQKRGQDMGLTEAQIQQATTERGQDIGAQTAGAQTQAQLTLGQGDLALRQLLGEGGLDVQREGLANQLQLGMGQLGLGYQTESDAVNEAIANYLAGAQGKATTQQGATA